MSLDAVPSGFSSAAAVTLLKTMRSTQSANSSFIASQGSSTVDARSKTAMSGDTMFSIIAAAAKMKSVTPSISSSHASTPQPDTNSNDSFPGIDDDVQATIGGTQALASDPYFRKSYTIDQAAQNWYAQMDRLVASMRAIPGQTQSGQTTGQILAIRSQWTGQQGADFAAKFDSRSLTFTDSTAVGVATNERTWISDGNGGIIGTSTSGHVDGEAMTKWRESNPNTVLIDDEGYRDGALLISW